PTPSATGSSGGSNGCASATSPLNDSVSSPGGVSRLRTVSRPFDTAAPASQLFLHGGSSPGSGSSRISMGGLSGSSSNSTATVMTNGPTGGCTPSQIPTTRPRLLLSLKVVFVCPQIQRNGLGLPAMAAVLPVTIVPSTGCVSAVVRQCVPTTMASSMASSLTNWLPVTVARSSSTRTPKVTFSHWLLRTTLSSA